MEQQKQYISDKIADTYKDWNPSDIVLIDGGTGSGKSYFILNVLAKHALEHGESVLYLVNRTALEEDILRRIERDKVTNVRVETCQQIEADGQLHTYADEKYIVCDECHYFTEDSIFNNDTDISYESIIKHINDKVLIFMSATGNTVINIVKEGFKEHTIHEYCMPFDFSHIRSVSFYNGKKKEIASAVIGLMNRKVADNEKVVYFLKDTDYYHQVKKVFPNGVDLVCSKNNKNYKYANPKAIVTYDKEYVTFDKDILCATKAMDNGVDLKDRTITMIINEPFGVESLLQSIGRKRSLGSDDKVDIIIMNYSKQELNGYLDKKQKAVREASILDVFGQEEYIKATGRLKFKHSYYIVYDEFNPAIGGVEYKIHPFIYAKEKQNIEQIQEIISLQHGYAEYIANLLGFRYADCSWINDSGGEVNNLTKYLESMVDIPMYKADQGSFIDIVDLRKNRKIVRNFEVIASYIEQKSDFELKRFKDKRRTLSNGKANPNRDKVFWIIRRKIEE